MSLLIKSLPIDSDSCQKPSTDLSLATLPTASSLHSYLSRRALFLPTFALSLTRFYPLLNPTLNLYSPLFPVLPFAAITPTSIMSPLPAWLLRQYLCLTNSRLPYIRSTEDPSSRYSLYLSPSPLFQSPCELLICSSIPFQNAKGIALCMAGGGQGETGKRSLGGAYWERQVDVSER